MKSMGCDSFTGPIVWKERCIQHHKAGLICFLCSIIFTTKFFFLHGIYKKTKSRALPLYWNLIRHQIQRRILKLFQTVYKQKKFASPLFPIYLLDALRGRQPACNWRLAHIWNSWRTKTNSKLCKNGTFKCMSRLDPPDHCVLFQFHIGFEFKKVQKKVLKKWIYSKKCSKKLHLLKRGLKKGNLLKKVTQKSYSKPTHSKKY